EDRPELRAHVREFAFEVALDADPVHRAAARGLRVADRRNVVFRAARRHAGFTPGAAVEIDRHSPAWWHQRISSSGCSRFSPAKRISCFRPSPTRVIRTRVAAHASVPVASSVSGARIAIGLAPRPLAYRVKVSWPCPVGMATTSGAMASETSAGARSD